MSTKKESSASMPRITLLVVVRNAVEYIEGAVNSLIDQDYPPSLIEIIIIDGESNDGTIEVIHSMKKEYPEIKLMSNPHKILASGWNMGIKHAEGDFVCRIDAHNRIDPNYIITGVNELLNDRSLICVGGVEKNSGTTKTGRLIADLFTSKFGVGNAYYRTGLPRKKYTDTAKCGIYRISAFEKFGLFDESLKRNQDVDFHGRLKKGGYRFMTHPGMKITYFVRSSLNTLIKKAFDDGFWISRLKNFHLRHFVPLLFILYLPFGVSALFIEKYLLLKIVLVGPLLLYFALALVFSVKDGRGLLGRTGLFFLFFCYHLCYGAGTLTGYFNRFFIRKPKCE